MDLGLFLEPIEVSGDAVNALEAVRIIEDYKPLDIQAGAVLLALCRAIRQRYPDWKYLIDGDGGVSVDGDVSVDAEPAPPLDSDFVVDEPLFVPQEFRGLAVYRVSTDGGFESVGRISTEFDDGFYWTAFTRGVFIDDDVFAVTNRGIRGAPVIDMASITYDIQFEQDRLEFLVDPIFDIGVSVSADEVDRE